MSAGTYTEFFVGTGGARTNAGDNKTNVQTVQNCTYLQGGGAAGADLFTAPSGTPFAASVAGDWIAIYTNAATQLTFLGRILVVNSSTSVDISTTSFAGVRPTNLSTWQASVGGIWPKMTGATTFPIGGQIAFVGMTNANGDMCRVNFQCLGNGTFGVDSQMTAASTNNANGPYVLSGYKTTPGDGAANPTNLDYKYRIDAGVTNATIHTVSGSSARYEDFVFSNNATGSVDGLVVSGARCTVSRCVAWGIRRTGFSMAAGSGFVNFIECEAYNCNIALVANAGGFGISAAAVTTYERCVAHDQSGASNANGFATTGTHGPVTYLECIADTNALHGFFVQPSVNLTIRFKQCVAYNNGADGIRISATAGGGSIHIESCNFEANGQSSGVGYGVNRTDSFNNMGFVYNCVFNTDATIGNKTGSYTGLTNFWDVDVTTFNPIITTTAEQFNAPSTGDFRTTGTASKGAGRGAFCQTQTSYSGTVGYPDVGAAQHQDSGGSGNTNIFPIIRRIMRPVSVYQRPGRMVLHASSKILPVRSPIRTTQKIIIHQKNRIAALLPGPAVTVPLPLRSPVRTIQKTVLLQKSRIAALLPGPVTSTVLALRPPAKQVSRAFAYHRNRKIVILPSQIVNNTFYLPIRSRPQQIVHTRYVRRGPSNVFVSQVLNQTIIIKQERKVR